MKFVPSAHYDDAAGNSFVFFQNGSDVFCYRSLGGGRLVREREWSRFPPQTITTLLRISSWLRMDLEKVSDPWKNRNFRFGNLNSCSDCGGIYA